MSNTPNIPSFPEYIKPMLMTEEQFHAWVAALRSGKYTQIKHCLHTPGGFCALGVAQDVVYPDSWIADTRENKAIFSTPEYFTAHLNNYFINSDSQDRVTIQNDTGLSFPEIADNLESLGYIKVILENALR